MAKVLILRLSSFGDVAMLVPAVYSVALTYPQDRFYVMTRKAFAPLFENLSFNVNVIPLDLKEKHRGISGFFHVYYKCLAIGISHVADEHDVLRTKILRWALMLAGKRVRHIDKGRKEKAAMIGSKVLLPPLKHTVERYSDVLDRLGFVSKMIYSSILDFIPEKLSENIKTILENKSGRWIGVSPFAKHDGKVYPCEKMEAVIERLSWEAGNHIFLFGSGKGESEIAEAWADRYENVYNIIGYTDFNGELALIGKMDVMLTMDSANMHIASLVETPVVSVWGATHPSLGFYGFRQDIENVVSVDLPCRPCSVYGELLCQRPEKDYACLNLITADMIISKLNKVLDKKR